MTPTLRLDPTHVENFARNLNEVTSRRRDGEFVEVVPGRDGSGLVSIELRPLDPDKKPRVSMVAFGSLKDRDVQA